MQQNETEAERETEQRMIARVAVERAWWILFRTSVVTEIANIAIVAAVWKKITSYSVCVSRVRFKISLSRFYDCYILSSVLTTKFWLHSLKYVRGACSQNLMAESSCALRVRNSWPIFSFAMQSVNRCFGWRVLRCSYCQSIITNYSQFKMAKNCEFALRRWRNTSVKINWL